MRHPYGAEDVDRESLHRCVRGQLLSAQPWCRSAHVVDQDVQVPVFVAYSGGRGLDAVIVSRIDVDEGRTELVRFGTTLRITGTGQHSMTEIDEPPGCLVAETLAGSDDQRDGHRASLQQGGSGVPNRMPLPWFPGRKLFVFRAPDPDRACSIRHESALATGCAAPDRPVLRASRMAPPRASSRAERRDCVRLAPAGGPRCVISVEQSPDRPGSRSHGALGGPGRPSSWHESARLRSVLAGSGHDENVRITYDPDTAIFWSVAAVFGVVGAGAALMAN